MKILVLNCGSSSLKFQLINMDNNERMAKGNFERIGGMKTTLKLNVGGKKEDLLHIARDYDEAIQFVLEVLLKPEYDLIKSLDEIGAVGHRIVHGGEMFSQSVLIDDKVIEEIEYEDQSKEAFELAAELWCFDLEEEGYKFDESLNTYVYVDDDD